ncbi:MAG: phosphoribosylglycinamide formyltransferase [Nannocystaceae bacterium]
MLLSPAERPPLTAAAPVRLGILASGSGSNFAAIADAAAAGDRNFTVVGVVCNVPGARVLERAADRGIPTRLVEHRAFASREAFDAAVAAALRELGAAWVAMAGWMRIATPTLLGAFPDRILNIHPSLLPAFRGMHAVEQALAAGVRIAGCTVHVVRPAVDDGPIVGQAAVPVLDGDTADALHQRIHAAEHALYPLAIERALAAGP